MRGRQWQGGGSLARAYSPAMVIIELADGCGEEKRQERDKKAQLEVPVGAHGA